MTKTEKKHRGSGHGYVKSFINRIGHWPPLAKIVFDLFRAVNEFKKAIDRVQNMPHFVRQNDYPDFEWSIEIPLARNIAGSMLKRGRLSRAQSSFSYRTEKTSGTPLYPKRPPQEDTEFVLSGRGRESPQ